MGDAVTDARTNMADIDDLMETTREMAEELRELTRERGVAFKETCSLYILAIRRLLSELKRFWELQAADTAELEEPSHAPLVAGLPSAESS